MGDLGDLDLVVVSVKCVQPSPPRNPRYIILISTPRHLLGQEKKKSTTHSSRRLRLHQHLTNIAEGLISPRPLLHTVTGSTSIFMSARSQVKRIPRHNWTDACYDTGRSVPATFFSCGSSIFWSVKTDSPPPPSKKKSVFLWVNTKKTALPRRCEYSHGLGTQRKSSKKIQKK